MIRRMTAADVIEVLHCLERAGVSVWIDGGWGVDALVGAQTREHEDLDLALNRDDLEVARGALEALGYEHDGASQPGLPARFVLRDEAGRQVDLHPLRFNRHGDGWQQLSETGNAWGHYPVADLTAKGTIDGREVRCLTPQLQLRFHLGYEWSERDEHDVRLLAERFDLPQPPSAP
jgi:lincosamide nucleotidyltransferase A/C/D/E